MSPFYAGMTGQQPYMASMPFNLGGLNLGNTSTIPSNVAPLGGFDINSLAGPVVGGSQQPINMMPGLDLSGGSTLPSNFAPANTANQTAIGPNFSTLMNKANWTGADLQSMGVSQSFLMLQSQVNTMMSGVLSGIPQMLASIASNPANFINSGMNASGASGGPNGTTNMNGQNVPAGDKNAAVKFFMSQGWSEAQAKGIVANLIGESGLKINNVGDGGKAYGLAQWHPDRQGSFAEYAKATGLSTTDIHQATFTEQLGFVDWELKNKQPQALSAMKAATTVPAAVEAFCRYFERPADVSGDTAKRIAIANSELGSVSV